MRSPVLWQRVRYVLGPAAAIAALLLVASCAGGTAPVGPAAAPAGPVAASATASPTTSHSGHSSQPAEPVAPLRAGEWFTKLAMPQPYRPVPPPGATDDYRCFLIDPGLTRTAYLTGSQFLPEHDGLVHHVIFYRVASTDVAQARKLDAAVPGEGWTCFGGTGISSRSRPGDRLNEGGDWVAAWAPGSAERLEPAGTGYPLPPGSQLVMQVHYNLLATNGKAAGTDQSAMELRLMDGAAKLRPLQTTLLPAPIELPCPQGQTGQLCNRELAVLDVMHRFGNAAGATVAGLNLLCNAGRSPVAGPTQHCDHAVRQTGLVYGLAGHMHLLGHSIKVELNPGTPRAQTLLNVKVYNFHDQSTQILPRPVAIKPGDNLRVTCTHDARLRQEDPTLRALPPRYVVWGDGTADEMCLGIVIWSKR
ncbi:MAG TPA: hypothetical protein VMU51_34075 [Mycobacteriales bacterium]|nr:hypothetical protein [Mycobacteriales bacterium]